MPELVDLLASNDSRWILACLAAGLVAMAGMRAHALVHSGVLAAASVGTVLVGAGGWWTGVLIVVFFVSSSALSRLRRETQPRIRAAKGGSRDAVQVFANGGIPMLLAMVAGLAEDPAPWLLATAGGIAGACADTWATEIGRTSMRPPRMITTCRQAPSGSSGAITTRGTLGALAGAAAIGLTASIGSVAGWWPPDRPFAAILVAVTMAGFTGALVDSVLGATVQAQYWCPRCDVLTEQPVHWCGTPVTRRRGFPFMTNDVVNALAIVVAAGAAGVLG